MTSRIGNKFRGQRSEVRSQKNLFSAFPPLASDLAARQARPRREAAGCRLPSGFTLVEVMVATAALAFSAALIYRAFFICADSFNYYLSYLSISPRSDEMLWQAQDNLSKFGQLRDMDSSGEAVINNRRFSWELSYAFVDEIENSQLYRIDLVTLWQAGTRHIEQPRIAYVLFKKRTESVQ
ncbi:MAG: prepilin-type N-terminal cleavage/methylation domain-containing protein [Candidatus Omnitrophica bacterium]|nr:prepilin-type N-terminal cleavage/methylation domain-containing protein [Candidatus Omnitrophota bacterium]